MTIKQSIGISHYNYALPSECVPIQDLANTGQLNSDVEFLEDTGFAQMYMLTDEESPYELMRDAAEATVAGTDLRNEEIDTLLLYRGVAVNERENADEILDLFSYSVAQLADDTGLSHSRPLAMSQQGCGGLFSAVDISRSILRASSKQAVLCVVMDVLPSSQREIMYNVMSDAAGAFLVEKNSEKNTIIDCHQQFQSYYWDAKEREQELLSAYFPMAQQTIKQCLDEAGLEISDIDWIVPHNINVRSWHVLAGLLEISVEKVWMQNISRVGHTVSCDHIINLSDMEDQSVIQKGDTLLLFTFGFGANWSCLLLEY